MTDTASEQPSTSEQEYVLAGGKNGATDSPADYDGLVMPAKKQGHKCKTVCWSFLVASFDYNQAWNSHRPSVSWPFYSSLGCGGCCDMRRATLIVNYVNMGK
jgi:hypothetical protein